MRRIAALHPHERTFLGGFSPGGNFALRVALAAPAADLARLARPPVLTVELTERGGHCGFIMDWRLHSWVDGRLDQLFRPGRVS